MRHIDRTLIDTGRTFGLSRWRILWQIILPGASPYIVTGLRIGLSIALILVTTAEMIAGSKGLGFFILDEERGDEQRQHVCRYRGRRAVGLRCSTGCS